MATEKRERKRANRQARLAEAMAAQERAKRRRQVVRIALVAAVVLAFLVIYWLVSRDGGDGEGATASTTSGASTTSSEPATTTTALPGETLTGATPCPPPDGSAERVAAFAEPPPLCIDPAKTYTAVFDTTAGTIEARLDTATTPQTVNNFVVLARYHYYDGTALFRTDPSIGIIQGGGLSNTDDPGYSIPDEGGKFTYGPGDLVMARTSQPDSAGAQFFFAVNEATAQLDGDGSYVTFGQVTQGLDVLESILASHQAQPANPLGGAPNPPVTVDAVRIVES